MDRTKEIKWIMAHNRKDKDTREYAFKFGTLDDFWCSMFLAEGAEINSDYGKAYSTLPLKRCFPEEGVYKFYTIPKRYLVVVIWKCRDLTVRADIYRGLGTNECGLYEVRIYYGRDPQTYQGLSPIGFALPKDESLYSKMKRIMEYERIKLPF